MSWNKVLQEIQTPMNLERLLFEKREVLNEDQKERLRKAWWQIHHELNAKPQEHQNVWNLAQNNAVVSNKDEDELIDVWSAMKPKLDELRRIIEKEHDHYTTFIFDILSDLQSHQKAELYKLIKIEYPELEKQEWDDMRKLVSNIRKVIKERANSFYELPDSPKGQLAVYQIKEK